MFSLLKLELSVGLLLVLVLSMAVMWEEFFGVFCGTSFRVIAQELPAEVKEAQQKRLEELKLQSDSHARAELERKMALRYRRVKFFGKFTSLRYEDIWKKIL